MSKELTLRQKEILGFIGEYLNENNYPPTIKEIGDYLNISPKGSYDHVKALQKKKYLSYEQNKRRSIKLLVLQQKEITNSNDIQVIPILGTIQAGLPILSHENFEGEVKVVNNMFGKGELFGLKIRGDSMIDAGINEEDIAIVKCMNNFENGEIIVVDTGNGVTIKKGYKEKENIRLEAANKKYSSILTRTTRIIGKLVGLIRKYE